MGDFFNEGDFVEKDQKVCLEWLEKAANQNNPWAMNLLGGRFRDKGDENDKKAVSYYRTAAELGWKHSMQKLAYMLRIGQGCAKDLRQAVVWSAQADSAYYDFYEFEEVLRNTRCAFEDGRIEKLDYYFDQLCYSLGWGLYWYRYEDTKDGFENRCLDYYCSCVELQQKSIFTFLLCWNRTSGGIKGPGQMIAQLVWNAREDNLVKTLEKPPRRSARMKRIKK
jgi:hypothetical protein